MASGDFDNGRWIVSVDGQVIDEYLSMSPPELEGGEPTEMKAGSNRTLGFATKRLSNQLNLELTVAFPSSTAQFLANLAKGQGRVDFAAEYDDPAELPDGELVRIVGRGPMLRGSFEYTDEPGARTYTIKLLGVTESYKNADDIVYGV